MSELQTVFFEYGGDKFEWHRLKAKNNLRKHGVTFEEGATIFGDEQALFLKEPERLDAETRWVLLGRSEAKRLLAVVHVERSGRIRIISARPVTRKEREVYE